MSGSEIDRLAHDASRLADGIAEGLHWQLKGELRKQEKRGDIAPLWRLASTPKPGILRVPYVRLRSAREARGRLVLRLMGVGALGAGTMTALLAALWEARFVILTGVGSALVIACVWLLSRLASHSPGCVGLHCPGCRG